mmetsp:Transcript_91279/g.144234  ORF Transcript_91279/g.144234 Transcript_91279/m.144234 type:complete len:115 (+) Transcript_91279:1462-1806(+)
MADAQKYGIGLKQPTILRGKRNRERIAMPGLKKRWKKTRLTPLAAMAVLRDLLAIPMVPIAIVVAEEVAEVSRIRLILFLWSMLSPLEDDGFLQKISLALEQPGKREVGCSDIP